LEACHDYVAAMMWRLASSDPDHDDLVQTVLLQILTSLPTFRGDAAFGTWVGGICVNVSRNHFRAKKSRGAVTPVGSTADVEPLARPAPAATPEVREEVRRCERALGKLSDAQRTAFILKVVEGHSVSEVAAMMGSAVSTTRLRIYYARKLFARALARERRQGGAK
jgi:RNA polymerase sigma-70 factor, ECF subfamily